jgi:hypothetical protein
MGHARACILAAVLAVQVKKGYFSSRGSHQMTARLGIAVLTVAVVLSLESSGLAQTPGGANAAAVWNALSAPAMDPGKSAHAENVEIVRDGAHIVLLDGTIQFAQPVNGVVFAAVFHGSGRLRIDPPNPQEAQQLRLFTREDKLSVPFTDATFSFTDGLLEEVQKQVKWQGSGPASDDLCAKRLKEREDLGESSMPRLLRGILSAGRARTAYFLADLQPEKGWIEFHDDATEPEEISVGRWVDVGPLKIFDKWMSYPAGGKAPPKPGGIPGRKRISPFALSKSTQMSLPARSCTPPLTWIWSRV